ncbi:TetR family transcriptional regulator [Dictyobacter vulcani]|uniref:TetR family transcriptional regulator n=1 Tax=Dictyobacter vulcani TaxID=2607529 RepID=A0A5J4KW36_9CHLR|nr:TetR/AcrR family transcriptional regulator [Dictyobacter vulcani]GER91713.1 TetR family transcriptional regulator [Dictyobacter vulcani]
MTKVVRGVGAGEPEVSRRRERAERILDAAAALILRWGFQKTTLDDVSRQAGVAKGTMYLHWKTREELFRALIGREKLAMAEDLRQRISADPAGATLRGILKYSALALMQRPLLKAVLMRDIDVLGKLAQGEQSRTAHVEKLMGFNVYLELLRDYGLIRTDLSLRAQIYMFSAIFMGFFFVAPLMPDEYTLSDEELADLMAETVHRTLEADRPVPADELQTISQNFMHYLDLAVEKAQTQFQKEVES